MSFRQRMLLIIAFILLPAAALLGAETVLKTDKDRVNYAIGVNVIGNFKQQGVEIDLDRVIQGMKDASSGGNLLLTDEEVRRAIKEYFVAVRQNQSRAMVEKQANAKKDAARPPAAKSPAAPQSSK